MEEIAISKFKAQCLAILDRVKRTRKPVRVTRFGKPMADLVPAVEAVVSNSWLGCMSESAKISGDIIAPAANVDDWEALS